MANVSLEIEGAEALLESFDVARRDRNKVMKSAMNDAAKACAKAMRSGIPSRWRGIIRSKGYITSDGTVGAAFGLSSKTKNARGNQPKQGTINDWFKAYWLNYGTLEGRDPHHEFSSPVKHDKTTAARRRKNRTGIKAQNFFDPAINGYENRFTEEFAKAMDKRIEKLFEK